MTVSRLRRSPRNSFVSFVNYRLYVKHEVMKTTTFLQNINSCKILNAYVYKEGVSSSPLVSFLLISYSIKFQLPSQKNSVKFFRLEQEGERKKSKGRKYGGNIVACENIRFSSLFAAGDVPRETSPSAKSEEKRMFSQARNVAEFQGYFF